MNWQQFERKLSGAAEAREFNRNYSLISIITNISLRPGS